MPFDPITAAIDLGSKLIDKVFPDKTQQDMAKLELLRMQQTGELQTTLSQLEINKVEAANPKIFVSGWRPFIGWIGGLTLAYQFIITPALQWYTGKAAPVVDTQALFQLILAMLGIGGMRTLEKVKGVTK